MNHFVASAAAVFIKDLRTEARTKERLTAMCFFAFLVLLVFNFALTPGSEAIRSAAGGVFWICVTFSGMFGLSRSFAVERENECLTGLLLAPADRGAIFLGKVLGNLVTMTVMEVLLLPLLAVLLNVEVWPHLAKLFPILLLGSLGFAAVGTLFSAMCLNSRLQEALLPLLTLPVLVPSILASVQSLQAVLDGATLAEVAAWLKLSAAFAFLFVAACTLLFDYVVEESSA